MAPYGVSDPDAGYINGDSRIGRQGSIPPGESIEAPMREIVNLITHAGFTPDEEDLEQLTKSIRSQRLNYAVAGGSANALTVTYDPAFTALTVGLILRVLVAANNTTAATIQVNALTAAGIFQSSRSKLFRVKNRDVVLGAIKL